MLKKSVRFVKEWLMEKCISTKSIVNALGSHTFNHSIPVFKQPTMLKLNGDILSKFSLLYVLLYKKTFLQMFTKENSIVLQQCGNTVDVRANHFISFLIVILLKWPSSKASILI